MDVLPLYSEVCMPKEALTSISDASASILHASELYLGRHLSQNCVQYSPSLRPGRIALPSEPEEPGQNIVYRETFRIYCFLSIINQARGPGKIVDIISQNVGKYPV